VPEETPWIEATRRAVDLVVSAGLLMLLGPLLLAVAVLVKLDSAGPSLFCQQRAGRNRRPFRILKFRSMRDGAEKLRTGLDGPQTWPVFKLADDPRLTRVGRVLRRLSLDELPQLLNVLRGDMALVGPRPLPVSDLERFEQSQRDSGETDESLTRWHRDRALVRPGMTGLWQICGRHEPGVDAWVWYDRQYLRERSLKLDVALLLRTLPAVLGRNGAT
jgi:lipopolysaccharide/colanic/teichoic acid biosynthesis glycosyltransferase